MQALGQGVALWQLQICVFGAFLARILDEEPESERSGNLSQTLTSGPKCSPEGKAQLPSRTPHPFIHQHFLSPHRRTVPQTKPRAVGRRTAGPHGDHVSPRV